MPQLTFKGRWLEMMGFCIGQGVVTVERGGWLLTCSRRSHS
ncbi:TPA: hypothetical protein QEG37_000676 [Pluralibacter gergoviae]|nr:hypothetical protein CRX51_20055 [Pluralibacter gergoviae]HDS1234322.1 hypothetical protein [Pluralibacter gergoviae]HDS1240159.1 hypothetical protein [Pluralibacter gergoviae]HDS1245205.1 hypothetical protein [Pluralibacter gergoviae]HDS1250743.1 hypothetical protein [Pluralibacter gergoviae]